MSDKKGWHLFVPAQANLYRRGDEDGITPNPKGVGHTGTPYVDTLQGRCEVDEEDMIVEFATGDKLVIAEIDFKALFKPAYIKRKKNVNKDVTASYNGT